MVPLRHKEIYQSDDGRYLEVFTKVGELPEVETEEDNEEKREFSPAEKIFVGVARYRI